MRESFDGLFLRHRHGCGIGLSRPRHHFQSWIDPLIVLAAVRSPWAEIMWMLFSRNPSEHSRLDGSLMWYWPNIGQQHFCLDLRQSANGIGRRQDDRRDRRGLHKIAAGVDDAGAMILGMIPMALGVAKAASRMRVGAR